MEHPQGIPPPLGKQGLSKGLLTTIICLINHHHHPPILDFYPDFSMPKELIKPAECTFELPQAAVRLMGGDGCLGVIGLTEGIIT